MSIEAHTPLQPGAPLIKGGIDVAWGAEKEERLVQLVGAKGYVEVDFSQHQTISVNGEERIRMSCVYAHVHAHVHANANVACMCMRMCMCMCNAHARS